MKAQLRVGPAGWSYPDWNGIVYPKRKPKDFDPLVYLASYFNLIEINNTFYRIPEADMCRSWASRTAGISDFQFTVKAFKEFTHSRSPATEGDVAEFKRAVDPLAAAGRLGAVLIQFPWSFRFETDSVRYVRSLHEWFSPLPTCFEVRHGAWGSQPALSFFRDEGITLCGIDQPLIGDSIGPDAWGAGGAGAYFRLHGRNRAEWFKPGTNRDLRYNYLYRSEELSGWVERIKQAAKGVQKIHVVLNNHFRGQAPANALELKSMLTGQRIPAPAPLVRAFPRLSTMLTADEPPHTHAGPARSPQPSLFDDNEKDQGEHDAARDQE